MCHCILWNCLSFGIESKSLWYDGVTHYQWHSIVQMGSGKGTVSPLLYNVYALYRWLKPSPPSNRCGVLCRMCPSNRCGCYAGCAWIYSLSYADDMVLLAPTITALQTLLEVCRAYAGLHDIVYNTTKTVCMLARPRQSQGRFSTRVRLRNEELSFVVEFRYLGHIMTADFRGDKDIN